MSVTGARRCLRGGGNQCRSGKPGPRGVRGDDHPGNDRAASGIHWNTTNQCSCIPHGAGQRPVPCLAGWRPDLHGHQDLRSIGDGRTRTGIHGNRVQSLSQLHAMRSAGRLQLPEPVYAGVPGRTACRRRRRGHRRCARPGILVLYARCAARCDRRRSRLLQLVAQRSSHLPAGRYQSG